MKTHEAAASYAEERRLMLGGVLCAYCKYCFSYLYEHDTEMEETW